MPTRRIYHGTENVQEPRKMAARDRAATIAAKWNSKQVAHLNEIRRYDLWCRLGCLDGERSLSTITVSPVIDPLRPTPKRLSQAWEVVGLHGSSPNLSQISRKIIYLSGIPNSDTPYYGDPARGPIRPYRDIVFASGLLTVILSEALFRTTEDHVLNLGRVLGLTVIADDGTEKFTAWDPTAMAQKTAAKVLRMTTGMN